MAKANGLKLFNIFHFLGRDLEDTTGLRIVHDLLERVDGGMPYPGKCMGLGAAGPFQVTLFVAERRFHGQSDPFHHGVEQVGLVLEMPIDGTAAGACMPGDVLQTGARHALRLKQMFGRIQQLVAGFQRFFFGSTGQGVSPERNLSGGSYTFISACKLYHSQKPYCFRCRWMGFASKIRRCTILCAFAEKNQGTACLCLALSILMGRPNLCAASRWWW